MLRGAVGKVMGMRSARSLTFALVTVATNLAAGLLALVGTTKPAEAAFPGTNGLIAFSPDLSLSDPTGVQLVPTPDPLSKRHPRSSQM